MKLDIKASYPHKKNLEITLAFLGEKNKEELEIIKKQLSKISLEKFYILSYSSIKILGIKDVIAVFLFWAK